MKTVTFKTTDSIKLEADVFGADAPGGPLKPVILFIHGGALIMGARNSIRADQLNRYVAAGYVVISIDYRLAPETLLSALVEDVEDAIKWIRSTGKDAFGVDPDRMAVIGHSAGGYLTLVTGHRADPPPKALISFYGYGNIAGDWYGKPDPFYNTFDRITEQQAYSVVGQDELVDGTDPERRQFYLWCRQNGLWPKNVGGCEPIVELDWFIPYSPAENVGETYPPTLLLHGTADTDVPYEQSVHMAERLAEAGVEHEFITIKDGPHGFDHNPDSTTSQQVADAFDHVIEFLNEHV
jgi:acetyl esterase/lipase